MDQQQKLPQSNDSNGFFLGVIVGAMVTALFTTQKGRDILREITDKSIESWDDVEKALEDLEHGSQDSPTTEYVTPDEKKAIKILAKEDAPVEIVKETTSVQPEPKSAETPEKQLPTPASEEKTITGRRWFRGLKKRA